MAKKVITTETLKTFKEQFDAKVEEKLESSTVNLTYATEQDILDLFATEEAQS